MFFRGTSRMPRAGRSLRLLLEPLEDRLAPALASLAEGPVAIPGGSSANDGPGPNGYTPAGDPYGLRNQQYLPRRYGPDNRHPWTVQQSRSLAGSRYV